MKDIYNYILTVLKANNIKNSNIAASNLLGCKDLLIIEIALRECESNLLNRFDDIGNPLVKTGLYCVEDNSIDIINGSDIRIECSYCEEGANICILPLFLYKALLNDYYSHLKSVSFYENGQIKIIGQSYNYLRYGIWTEYYSNGKVMSQGEYINSQKVKTWNYFHENGLKRGIELYDINGLRDGIWETWYSNGQIQSSSLFRDNEYSGDDKCWYENGQLSRFYRYSGMNKYQDGEHINWHENGNLTGIPL
jgi:antitoxin component YwqK of YwqJK toxin-antitoxin module